MAKSKRRPTIYSSEYEALLALLVRLRERAGIKQTTLASKLRIDQSTVSKFERGERLMDLVLFRDWCRAIGSDPTTVFKEWDKQAV